MTPARIGLAGQRRPWYPVRAAVLAAIGAAVLAVAGCDTRDPHLDPVRIDVDEVIVHEHTTAGFDVDPPAVLSVVMDPAGDPAARCADMGGRIDDLLVCRGVDY